MNQGEQMRFSKDELATFSAAFKGNEKLIKLMRKVFLPELDASAPLGQNMDLYLTLDIKNMPADDAKVLLVARNQLIQHIEQQLMQIKVLANMEDKDVEEKAADAKKDSAK